MRTLVLKPWCFFVLLFSTMSQACAASKEDFNQSAEAHQNKSSELSLQSNDAGDTQLTNLKRNWGLSELSASDALSVYGVSESGIKQILELHSQHDRFGSGPRFSLYSFKEKDELPNSRYIARVNPFNANIFSPRLSLSASKAIGPLLVDSSNYIFEQVLDDGALIIFAKNASAPFGPGKVLKHGGTIKLFDWGEIRSDSLKFYKSSDNKFNCPMVYSFELKVSILGEVDVLASDDNSFATIFTCIAITEFQLELFDTLLDWPEKN